MNVAQKYIITTMQEANVDVKRSKPFYPLIDESVKKLGYKVFVLNRNDAFETYKGKTQEITRATAIKHIGKRVRAVKKAWELMLTVNNEINMIVRYVPKTKKTPMKFFIIENYEGISDKEERIHRFTFIDNNTVISSFHNKRSMEMHCGDLRYLLEQYFNQWFY